jgi:hypothetical protein
VIAIRLSISWDPLLSFFRNYNFLCFSRTCGCIRPCLLCVPCFFMCCLYLSSFSPKSWDMVICGERFANMSQQIRNGKKCQSQHPCHAPNFGEREKHKVNYLNFLIHIFFHVSLYYKRLGDQIQSSDPVTFSLI